MQFSVLMSLYHKEKAEFFDECLTSLKRQTVQPLEVVIVEDGPLNDELYDSLNKWKSLLPIKTIPISSNVGLGQALNTGLKNCECEIVARMDTDDICDQYRFEKQLAILTADCADVCGSNVAEFETDVGIIHSFRKLPTKNEDIVNLSRFKNPMNHPTVMFRKSAVLKVGSYEDVRFFEDYHLWLKLIRNGSRFYNIDESLVSMRAGQSQLSRRGGLQYARLELSFLLLCRKQGIMSTFDTFRNVIIRLPIRILPPKLLGKVYRLMRSRNP
ncbi:glycosyltransferase [Vibrio alginolyticus]|uniref:glycosyltransferase n=1 Tax=Vibrio alginolyticus TaxID=663 RepID=UPI0037551CA1